MTNPDFGGQADHDNEISPATASRMLADADRVSASAQGRVDLRTQSLIQACSPLVLFAYTATFLLLFTYPAQVAGANVFNAGPMYANILLIPLLAQTQLMQGARNRIPVSDATPLKGRKLLFVFLGIAAFVAIAAMSLLGVKIAWWVSILVAVCAAAPPAVLAVISSKKARIQTEDRPSSGIQPPLGKPARYVTLGLGIYFGIAGVSTTLSWFPLAALVLLLVLLGLVFRGNTRWGLVSVGSEWQRHHWIAFGASFLLFFALTLIVVRTSWNTPVVGIIGGALIVAPMVIAALTSSRQK